MRIKLGDLFIIETEKHTCLLQYSYYDEACGYLVRVFVFHKGYVFDNFENIINKKEDFNVFFFLKFALKDGSVKKVGNFSVPDIFLIPNYMRDKSIFNNSKYKWRIVPLDPTKRQIPIEELNEEQVKLSPYQMWYSEGFIEAIDSGFSLETWR